MTLTIYDQASGASGDVSFDGELFGYFTPANDHVQTYYTGTLTKSILVGKHLYTVEMDDYVADTADCTTGHVTAIATVIVQSLPEPSAAVLAALGLSAAGLFWMVARTFTGCFPPPAVLLAASRPLRGRHDPCAAFHADTPHVLLGASPHSLNKYGFFPLSAPGRLPKIEHPLKAS